MNLQSSGHEPDELTNYSIPQASLFIRGRYGFANKEILTDREGFEPPGLLGPPVFKTGTLNQTQTSIHKKKDIPDIWR